MEGKEVGLWWTGLPGQKEQPGVGKTGVELRITQTRASKQAKK